MATRQQYCSHCHQGIAVRSCACLKQHYCSEKCRENDWAIHHLSCPDALLIGARRRQQKKDDFTSSTPDAPVVRTRRRRRADTKQQTTMTETADDNGDDDDEDLFATPSMQTPRKPAIVPLQPSVIDQIPPNVKTLQFCQGTREACEAKITEHQKVLTSDVSTPGMTINEFIDLMLNTDQEQLLKFKNALQVTYSLTWDIYREFLEKTRREQQDIKNKFFNFKGQKWEDVREHGSTWEDQLEGWSVAETRIIDILLIIRENRSYFDVYDENVVGLPDIAEQAERQESVREALLSRRQPTERQRQEDIRRAALSAIRTVPIIDVESDEEEAIIRLRERQENVSLIGAKTRTERGGDVTDDESSDQALRHIQRQSARLRRKENKEVIQERQKLFQQLFRIDDEADIQYKLLTDLQKDEVSKAKETDYVRVWIEDNASQEWGRLNRVYTKQDLRRAVNKIFKKPPFPEDELQTLSAAPEEEEDGDDDSSGSDVSVEMTKKRKLEIIDRAIPLRSSKRKRDELARRALNLMIELRRMDDMTGLGNIKTELVSMVLNFIDNPANIFNEEGGHLGIMLLGPPGTGKTSIATRIYLVYLALGIVSAPPRPGKKVNRYGSDALISGFEGQTPIKTLNLLLDNIGNVFLIDEIYELASGFDPAKKTGGGYGLQAINTFVQKSDDLRGLIVPIGAGYYDLITEKLFKANKGLQRRFPNQWVIYAYTSEELIEIFRNLVVKSNLTFCQGCVEPIEYNDDTRSHLQVLTESLIRQAREEGYFVDQNAAGVALFIRKIQSAVTVRLTRSGSPASMEGRRLVLFEDVTAGFKKFIDSSGEPRTREEVARFDEHKGDLIFFYDDVDAATAQ